MESTVARQMLVINTAAEKLCINGGACHGQGSSEFKIRSDGVIPAGQQAIDAAFQAFIAICSRFTIRVTVDDGMAAPVPACGSTISDEPPFRPCLPWEDELSIIFRMPLLCSKTRPN